MVNPRAGEALNRVLGILEENTHRTDNPDEKAELEQSMNDIKAILARWGSK